MGQHDRGNEWMVALCLLGAVLLLPPVLLVFNAQARILGVPLLYLYIFAAWIALIALAAAISMRLVRDAGGHGEGSDTDAIEELGQTMRKRDA